MAGHPRRATVVLCVITLAVIALGVWAWEPVYWWVMTERVPIDGSTSFKRGDVQVYENEPLRGFRRVRRWSGRPHGPHEMWFSRTRYQSSRRWFEDGELTRWTSWSMDGAVRSQSWYEDGTRKERHSHPWLWRITDQTHPTMPEWMTDDALWQAALDAQK